jgi:predicted O-methyltransferase YrrM
MSEYQGAWGRDSRMCICKNCGGTFYRPPVTEPVEENRPTGRIDLPEARFTPPSDFCGHPQFWHSQDSDSTEWEVSEMIAGLVRGLQPRLVVETGSAWGQTTREIGKALVRNKHGYLVSLDPEPERWTFANWYCHEFVCTGWMQIVQRSSLDYTFSDEAPWGDKVPAIDLLFSDSFFNVRIPEIEHFEPWTHAGTLILMHDTRPGSFLQHSLDGLDPEKYRNIRLHTPRGLTLVERIF